MRILVRKTRRRSWRSPVRLCARCRRLRSFSSPSKLPALTCIGGKGEKKKAWPCWCETEQVFQFVCGFVQRRTNGGNILCVGCWWHGLLYIFRQVELFLPPPPQHVLDSICFVIKCVFLLFLLLHFPDQYLYT